MRNERGIEENIYRILCTLWGREEKKEEKTNEQTNERTTHLSMNPSIHQSILLGDEKRGNKKRRIFLFSKK